MVADELLDVVGGGVNWKWSSAMPTKPSQPAASQAVWSCIADAGSPNIFCAETSVAPRIRVAIIQVAKCGTSEEVIH